MYIGPATDQVDEFGVPLVNGAPIANNTSVVNGVASPMEVQQVPQIPFGMRQQMINDHLAPARRQYAMEVESADRLRRQQEAERYLAAGVKPPEFLSEFSPALLKQQVPVKPEFLKSGEDWYQIGQTGVPELLIRGKPLDKFAPPTTIESAKRLYGEPPEGFVYALGPSGITMERKPARGIEEIFGQLAGRGTQTSQPKSDRTEQGGYKLGRIYGGLKYIGGNPLVESSWEK